MRVALIRSWDELAAISDQWNDLLSSSRADTIFLRWEWVSVWKQVFGENADLFVITVRDNDGQLIGLAPFYKVEYKLCKILSYTVLRAIADSASGSEYPAWIVSSNIDSDEVYDAIVSKLESCIDEWDCIWMQGVRVWGGQAKNIFSSVKRKFFVNCRKNNSSAVSLVCRRDNFLKSLSGNMRSQLRRDKKKVLADGELSVDKCIDEHELERYLNTLFKLHDIRWQQKGLQGMFERRPKEMDFYRCFVPIALRNGWLSLYALNQNDSIKAIQLGYIYQNVYSQLQEGFDPVGSSGAGNTLRLHIVEACIKQGIPVYDFLGEHTEHKRRWGGKVNAGYDLFTGRKSLKNLILFKLRIWPTGRYFKQTELKND